MHLAQVGQLAKGLGVAQRHVADAMVGQRRHRRDGRGLLATTGAGGADEEAGELAVEGAGLPLAAGAVPEGLPLRGEVAVARGNAEEEAVVLGERGGVREDLDVRGLGGRVHLGEDLVGERLGDLEEIGGAAGGVDALDLGLG